MVFPGILADGSVVGSTTAAAIRRSIGIAGMISVRDFGAIGDGVTVDKIAFRDAMDAAVAAGVPLFVPPGEYNVGLLNYDPAIDAELVMIGIDAETTVIIGDISSNGFLDVPDGFTGKLRFEGIHFKDFFRFFDFSQDWMAGDGSTIQEFSMHRCKATQVATTGVRSVLFIAGDLSRNHVIKKLHITNSYFEFGSCDASAHILQLSAAAINDLKIDRCEFVGGQRQVNWMPDTGETGDWRFDVKDALPSPKITNNLFRDVSAEATNTSMIRIAGLNIDISRNTFRNFESNEEISSGAIYAQGVGEISFNSFEDCYCSLGAIYSKGTPKFSAAKISTVSRTSNVAEIISIKEHGLITGDVVDIVDCSTEGINGIHTVTVTDTRTFTIPNTGDDVVATAEPLGYAYDGQDRSGYDLDVSWNRFTHTRQSLWSTGVWLARCSHAVRNNTFDGWYSNGNDACIRIDSTGDFNYDILIDGNRFRGCNSGVYINVLSLVTEGLQIKNNTVSDSFNGGAFCRLVGTGTYKGLAMERNTIIQNNPDVDVVSMLDVTPLSSGTITLDEPILTGNRFTGDNVSDCRMFIFRSTTNIVDPTITKNWGPDRTDYFLVEAGTVNWSGAEIIRDNYTAKKYRLTANTDDGPGSTIAPLVESVEVTAVNADSGDWIALPSIGSLPVGFSLQVVCNAGSDFNIRTPAASGEQINGVDADGTNEFLAVDGDVIQLTSNGTSWLAKSAGNVAYTAANLPNAAFFRYQQIYVSDGAAGNPVLAFSDGTVWLRLDTLTAVSGS